MNVFKKIYDTQLINDQEIPIEIHNVLKNSYSEVFASRNESNQDKLCNGMTKNSLLLNNDKSELYITIVMINLNIIEGIELNDITINRNFISRYNFFSLI
jgi:hypothetical protein